VLDVVSKICSMSRDYQHKSMVQLLKESGYLGNESSVNKSQILDFIGSHPGLMDDWLLYSADKRVKSGWYLLHDNQDWIVGYFNGHFKGNKQIFTSGYEATAVFIMNELGQIVEHLC
jgi:hypothetical protein